MSYVVSLPFPAATLETELDSVLSSLRLDERQSSAVAARLGWDGTGATTLEAAARPLGYSRERVRQLEDNVRVRAGVRVWDLPFLDRALGVVENAAPDAREHVAHELRERGLSRGPFDPSGVLTAASILGRVTTAEVRGGLVVATALPDPTTALVKHARRLAAERGAANVVEIALETGLERNRVRRLLDLVPEVRWLDDRQTWTALGTPDTPRRVSGILKKMLVVTPRLRFAEADDGLRRSFRPVALPPHVLRRIYDGIDWLQVDGPAETLSSVKTLDPDRELSPVERALLAVFEEAGPVLTFSKVVALGARHGLNRNTVGYYLRHAPIFALLSRGRYALRGPLSA
jgi:hypothetical protein